MKKSGEKTTTMSVSLRLDPKTKFAADLLAKEQKRSLTAVFEWAISQALARESTQTGESFEKIANDAWSTDDAVRFANVATLLPSALSYDEMRLWETIKRSPCFWVDSEGAYSLENLNEALLSSNWENVWAHSEVNKNSPTVTPFQISG